MIECKNVAVAQEGRTLFSDVNVQLHKPQKVGLVGNNGTGKSTLFATILGTHHPEAGSIEVPPNWHIAHMAQEVQATNQSAMDYVLSGDATWYALKAKIDAQHTLSQDDIANVYQQFDEIDGYRTPSKAAQVLSGLGFGEHEHHQSVATFSGGWRMRLNLARTLMSRADVLLLDEPTNHLDLDAILWLEEWLTSFDGLVLLISHDQAFLDAVCHRILHIEHQKITLYTGNYSQFMRIRAERLTQQQQAFEKQQATRAHLENYIRRFRAKATKAKQAQSRIKQLSRMSELTPVIADGTFGFEFYEPSHMASPLISLECGAIGYHSDKPLLTKVHLQITPETRLGILGANGTGKSTLIKTLVGELPLLSGVYKTSQTLKLGYFSQHQMDSLDNDATPMILLRRLAAQTSDAVLRAFLGSFAFAGDKIDTPCRLFSGGERARLTLALIVWQRPNVLILDEPTNHLDLSMQHALTLALQQFMGALILVSHDRELMMSVCDNLLLVADGKAAEFTGDMNDYAAHLKQARQTRLSQLSKTTNAPKPAVSKEELRKKNADNRQKTAPLRKKIAQLEKQLTTLGNQLDNLQLRLSEPAVYDDDQKAQLMQLLSEQSAAQKQLANTEDALLVAMDELETLEKELG
ncbi:MAG: ATP-binding cassette domain-containing protein [Moraxella sp.]|nr:ATP-binding cassette domain-containing protein [Moraxella sp.]